MQELIKDIEKLQTLSKDELISQIKNYSFILEETRSSNFELNKSVEILIEEKRNLEISLRESDALYKAVVDNSLDGTLIIDKDFIVLYGNEEIYKIGSYSSEDMFGQDFRNFLDKDALSNFVERINFTSSHPDTDNRFESTMLDKNRNKRNIFLSASLNEDFQGTTVFVCQILDITEIKKAEEAILKMNDELEKKVVERTTQLEIALSDLKNEIKVRHKAEEELQAAKEEVTKAFEQEKELNTLKTRFISMISHEYRTPLTVILTSTYLIEQFYQGPNQLQFNKFLDKIRSSVKSMTQLLQDVLTIGKSEAGKTNLQINRFRAIDLCKDIIEECQVMDNNVHTFELNFSDKTLELESDEKQLKHVLSNLVLNAAKYSPKAKTVTINIIEALDKVTFQIIDQGIGIPEADQEHLFEAFYRAGNVGAISGTGLGLAIVKKCIDLLKGEITFESISGVGTTFNITLDKVISNS